MFGIGFSELAIIALVVILVIKPDDLPLFFRKLGRLYAQAKKVIKEVSAVKDEFIKEMDIAAAVQESDEKAAPAPEEASSKDSAAPDSPAPAHSDLSPEEIQKRSEESSIE